MNEYTWPQFKNLNHIKDLPLQEQISRYRFYLDELSNQLINQNKGNKKKYLLQENGSYILQQNGNKIYV